MYEKNVSLVKDYHSVAGDLREVVMMSTQTMTRLADEIRQNQYCPLIRIDKKQISIGERHDNIIGKGRHERETGGGGA
jgi:aspartate/glutamate racemase